MLKNKEDNFLGDNITHNIKYGDNEWQAHGTIDREPAYTKESILNLIFEEYQYNAEKGEYNFYIPRASVQNTLGKNFIGAKLTHDISVLDTRYYSSTPIESSINIFDLQSYLNKGFNISNPVFDYNTKFETIQIVDPDKINEDVTIKEFFDVINPHSYETDGVSPSFPTGETYPKLLNRYSLKESDLYSSLKKKLQSDESFAKIFQSDFQLHLHDPSNIKLPFNMRTDLVKEDWKVKDNRTYRTRFISNSYSPSLKEQKILVQTRIEFLNDLIEEAILNNDFKKLYGIATDVNLPSEVLTGYKGTNGEGVDEYENWDEVLRSKKFGHLIDKVMGNSSEKSQLTNLIKNINNMQGMVSYLLPPVYTDYSDSVNFKTSEGIHFESQEDTTNLFQNEDESYKIFNEVVLGYNLINGLLSARTFIGSVLTLIDGDIESDDLDKNIPLYMAVKFNYVESDQPFYPTVSILNNAYKMGHGETLGYEEMKISNTELSFKNTSEGDTQKYLYVLNPVIKNWLEKECFIFKGPVYGDYVEELNFMQDLNPDSDVQFKNLRLKKTEIPYKRLQDSKYEVPYVEQTNPLLNNTPENPKEQGSYASLALGGIGDRLGEDGEPFVFPPYIYDYDKGSEESKISDNVDMRVRGLKGASKQRVNNKAGGLTVEDRLISPTIDELWTFLKYLTESDGKTRRSITKFGEGINERLPSFFGTKKASILNSLFTTSNGKDNSEIENTVNPLAKGIDENEREIDILNWNPTTENSLENLHYTTEKHPELQFGGFKVTRYIEKIYDYKVDIFGRRSKGSTSSDTERTTWDASKYEFNTEDLSDYNKPAGYLEKLFNSAILSFSIDHMNKDGNAVGGWHLVDERNFTTDELDNSDVLNNSELGLFTEKNDSKLLTSNKPVQNSKERQKAFETISKILTWHKAVDGKNDLVDGKETSFHNHFKKYLDQPKNLKEIERDLETIRQNMQAFVEFYVAQSAAKGFNDRGFNRGTLHELHRNHFGFDSTLLRAREGDLEEVGISSNLSQTWPSTEDDKIVVLKDLSNALNNLRDSLEVITMDKKVVFDDGQYDERYQKQNYDRYVIDLGDPITNKRWDHEMYRHNETLLSEIYLAADGTWRSVHEHFTAPIVYDDF